MWNTFQKQMRGTSQKSFLEGLEEFSLAKGSQLFLSPDCTIALLLLNLATEKHDMMLRNHNTNFCLIYK